MLPRDSDFPSTLKVLSTTAVCAAEGWLFLQPRLAEHPIQLPEREQGQEQAGSKLRSNPFASTMHTSHTHDNWAGPEGDAARRKRVVNILFSDCRKGVDWFLFLHNMPRIKFSGICRLTEWKSHIYITLVLKREANWNLFEVQDCPSAQGCVLSIELLWAGNHKGHFVLNLNCNYFLLSMISFPIWGKSLQHKAFAPGLNGKFSISWLLLPAREKPF